MFPREEAQKEKLSKALGVARQSIEQAARKTRDLLKTFWQPKP
jgi:hypothetical protein